MRRALNLRKVAWSDLVPLTRYETFIEATLPLPWLAASIYAYDQRWWIAGLVCSFYFFLTGLRLSHGAQHFSIGLSRTGHHIVLFCLSVLMLASMHAVQASHLHHHRHCLEEDDSEGKVAELPWWQALLAGPSFLLNLHRNAWRIGDARQRKWIGAELLAVGLIVAALLRLPGSGLSFHFGAMIVGECLTAFFAVWIVHHDCEEAAGRTQRGALWNFLSYKMFFHREHHLYPAVPTPHLDRLAERLDGTRGQIREVLPRLNAKGR